MALQAYVDGSGSGDPDALVLAGYVATAETWAKFSTEWQKRLDEVGLKRFKMHEMATSRMEFAGYFYRVIEEFDVLAAISCVIRTDDLRKVLREIRLPDIPNIQRLENPYYLGFRCIIETLARHQRQLRLGEEPIDFIFDDQSEKAALVGAWDLMKFAATPDIQPLLGDTPIFRPDDKVMPLQAADLYAWWVLKWQREGDSDAGVRDFRFAWEAKRKINRLHVEYTEDELRRGVIGIIEKANTLALESAIGRRGVVQEMAGGWGRVDFTINIRHIGSKREFYGHKDDDLEFEDNVRRFYEAALDTARVFIHSRDGLMFSAAEMLGWFLAESSTRMEDYVPPEEAALSLADGTRAFTLSFPIDFPRNTFHALTKSGPVDLKRLELLVEVTLTS